MRIWDRVPPNNLCRNHLLAQWREGLGLWNILTQGKTGYANHPETKRWRGHESALYSVLAQTRNAMLERKYKPKELPQPLQYKTLETLPEQWDNQLVTLINKMCQCRVD